MDREHEFRPCMMNKKSMTGDNYKSKIQTKPAIMQRLILTISTMTTLKIKRATLMRWMN
jgi:hypothetical protein